MPIPFDPADPFPFFPLDTYSYDDAKAHAIQCDRWLGLDIDKVETELQKRAPVPGVENWAWLSPQSFMTPYIELRSLLEDLKPAPGQTVVDLGCAYARMAFVMQRHFPGVRFTGYELEGARVDEVLRKLAPSKVLQVEAQDLTAQDFELPRAEFYFIYDFGSQPAIAEILGRLRILAQGAPLTVIARGRGVRQQIHGQHPWLCEVQNPRHFQQLSIYRS